MNALLLVFLATTTAAPQMPSTDQGPAAKTVSQVLTIQQPAPADDRADGARASRDLPGSNREFEPTQADPRHRIEFRFGMWRNPRFSFHEPTPDFHTGSADFSMAFGYLHAISPDLSVGVEALTRVRGTGEHVDHEDTGWSSGGTTVFTPVVVRWDFARRLTPWRAIEPYVSGGIGPLVRADWTSHEADDDWTGHSDGEVTIGGRLALGFDAHIGSVWTIGLQAGWNWSEKPGSVIGYGRHDRGGEIAITSGWVFGRHASR